MMIVGEYVQKFYSFFLHSKYSTSYNHLSTYTVKIILLI